MQTGARGNLPSLGTGGIAAAPSLGAGAQTTLSYRGAALGADQEAVLAIAKKEFRQLIPLNLNTLNPEETVNLLAGTGFTPSDQSCPYGAEKAQLRPCHLVRYIFSSPSDGAKLATVEVTQSFDVPLQGSVH
ncbi:hypothetical protein [Cupriavidus oxalaticus]|uniref:hypothetical protein n=1 Tax=Cupriavidus oxalaticus TaxID=96344 RepID=UPI003D65AF39